MPSGRGSAGAAGDPAGAGAGGHLAADHRRVRLPDLQLGNGDLQVGQGRGCYCLRDLLLLRPPPPLLLPPAVREDGARLAAPRADQGRRVAAHTMLTAVFSYKVAAIMPLPVQVLVWAMAAATVLGGFYAFFLHSDTKA